MIIILVPIITFFVIGGVLMKVVGIIIIVVVVSSAVRVDAERVELEGPVDERHVLDVADRRRRGAELLAALLDLVDVVHHRVFVVVDVRVFVAGREGRRVGPVVVIVYFVGVVIFTVSGGGRRGRGR